MRSPVLLLFIFLVSTISYGQTYQEKVAAYVHQYHPIAIQEQWRTGIPASIKLAQAILESGAGEGELAGRSNNHFGIKCKSNWQGPTVYHDDDLRGECFRAYESVLASFKDHSDFLVKNQRYAFLFDIDPQDYEAWARGLKKAGYATNPAYSQSLVRVIETYGLNDYTLLALNNQKGTSTWVVQNAVPVSDNTLEMAIEAPKAEPAPQPTKKTATKDLAGKIAQPISQNLKVTFVNEGTPLLQIAAENKLTLGDLLRFNDLPYSTTVAAESQYLFLEKKKKRKAELAYTCKGGETPWQISQYLGIQLKELLKINQLPEESILPSGKIIKAG